MASISKINQTLLSVVNNKKLRPYLTDTASSAVSLAITKPIRYISALPNEALYNIDVKTTAKFYNNPTAAKISNEVADTVLEKTGLSKKGVKIYDINLKNINDFETDDIDYASLIDEVARGKNAFYANRKIKLSDNKALEGNSVLINREKTAPTLLHELGHADNYNNSKFLRALSLISPTCSSIASNMPKVAAVTKNIPIKEGSKFSKLIKAQNAIHKFSPLIAGVFRLPCLIDEAMASKKAVKWAGEFGSEKFAKELSKKLKLSYSTYTSAVFSDIVTTAAAKTSKDKIIQKIQERL